MSGRTKPRRHRPLAELANPVLLALRRACKVPADEIAQVMTPIETSFTALREGVASENQWAMLAGSVELGLAVEYQGVIKGLQGHLHAAEQALAAIKTRAMTSGAWMPTALYYQEIEAVDTFVWLHKRQLENLSEGEWRKAHDRARALVLGAGGRAIDIKQIEGGHQQLTLIGAAT